MFYLPSCPVTPVVKLSSNKCHIPQDSTVHSVTSYKTALFTVPHPTRQHCSQPLQREPYWLSFLHFFFLENKDGALATLLSFHCTTIVGGLEHVNQVNELQMTHLLKSLFRGLTSPIQDYVAASYMIVAQLTRRTQFSPQIFCGIINKVAGVCCLASFEVFMVVYLRILVFWDVMLCHWSSGS